jgi:hypothetical protein
MQVTVTPETALQAASVTWSFIEVVLALVAALSLAGSAMLLRFKGVRAAAFPFVICIALTLALGSAAEGVSAALNAPLFVDFIIWGIVFAACLLFGVVIYCLCPNLKTGALLAVLGLSPLCFFPQRAALKPVVETGLGAAVGVAARGGKIAGQGTPSPQKILSGAEIAADAARTALKADQIGWIGETVTVRHIEATYGFTQLKSKYRGNSGFDAVFEGVEDGKPVIYIVEAKANTAVLSPGQMTDEWIADTLSNMAGAKDSRVRQTGMLVEKALAEGRVKRVLSEVDLEENTITLTHLDGAGKKVGPGSKVVAYELIEEAKEDVAGAAIADAALAPAA